MTDPLTPADLARIDAAQTPPTPWTHPEDGTVYDLTLTYLGSDSDEWRHTGWTLDGHPIMRLTYPVSGGMLELGYLHAAGGPLPPKPCGAHIGPGKFCDSLPVSGSSDCHAHGGDTRPATTGRDDALTTSSITWTHEGVTYDLTRPLVDSEGDTWHHHGWATCLTRPSDPIPLIVNQYEPEFRDAWMLPNGVDDLHPLTQPNDAPDA